MIRELVSNDGAPLPSCSNKLPSFLLCRPFFFFSNFCRSQSFCKTFKLMGKAKVHHHHHHHHHGLALITIVMMGLLLCRCARSAVYTVGDERQWNSEENFGSWAQEYNFSVGDVLEFIYVKGQHNVYEVKETTYRSCDASSGVLAKYESGDDHVQLTQPKRHWFICNLDGHCLGGMRFFIDVKPSSSSNPNSSSTNGGAPKPIPEIQPTPPPSSHASPTTTFQFQKLGFWALFVVLGILARFGF